jgi:hypothetical protein
VAEKKTGRKLVPARNKKKKWSKEEEAYLQWVLLVLAFSYADAICILQVIFIGQPEWDVFMLSSECAFTMVVILNSYDPHLRNPPFPVVSVRR